ncbi:hypothetical protein L2E82_16925 [Cichorium intybus]|uniref:Uncharacterized protein n=1 Tax=Cichorium intybus TaxID=13427 RepID=A0ACB9F7J4_CICIN|nr:hypothetical protein L2E82_16925 [Cichorium intybus]
MNINWILYAVRVVDDVNDDERWQEKMQHRMVAMVSLNQNNGVLLVRKMMVSEKGEGQVDDRPWQGGKEA